MNENVIFVVEFSIKPGGLDTLKSLVQEIIADIRPDEPGTINYEYFISEDGENCQIVERYLDFVAALRHLGKFGEKFAERLSAISEPKSFKVCGHLSPELRAVVIAAGALDHGSHRWLFAREFETQEIANICVTNLLQLLFGSEMTHSKVPNSEVP